MGFAKFEKPDNKIEDIKESLLLRAQHVKLLHPVLVLESALWELKDGSMNPLNYFRLIFQKLYDDVTWIDVVNKDHLDEYLEKANKYKNF